MYTYIYIHIQINIYICIHIFTAERQNDTPPIAVTPHCRLRRGRRVVDVAAELEGISLDKS